ncbi:MAG: hypothetical protein ACI4E0_04735 [Blautia sp.]
MANARKIIIQPQGSITTFTNKNGTVIARLDWNEGFKREYTESFNRKQAYVDQECIRRMAPETPRRTGVLIKSATLGTAIGNGEIHQIAPYARRQYYEHKEKSYWFERMKNRHKDSILKGAQSIE